MVTVADGGVDLAKPMRFKVFGNKLRTSMRTMSRKRTKRVADEVSVEGSVMDLSYFAKALGEENSDDLFGQSSSSASEGADSGDSDVSSTGIDIPHIGGDLEVVFESAAEGATPLSGAALDTLKDAAKMYSEGRVLAACNTIIQLSEVEGAAAVHAACDLEDIDLMEMQRSAQTVVKCLQDLADNTGWAQVSTGNLKAWFRQPSGRSWYSFKFMGVFNSPLDHLLAITKEVDLHPSWTTTCVESAVLHEVSEMETYCYGAQWQPAPFKDKDSVFVSRQYDLSREDGSVLMSLQSVADDQLPPGALHPPKTASVRERVALLQGSCIRLKPLPPTPEGKPRTLGHFILNIAPLQSKALPASLLKYFFKTRAPTVYRHAQKVLDTAFTSPNDVIPLRMAQRQGFYDRIKSLEAYCIRRQLFRKRTFGPTLCK